MINDIKAGFVVFLIALPLSIGIALASGTPASAGIWAAIVGGILGSFLGGSQLTINGPAAGLIVVVVGAVDYLGQGDPQAGYRYMLAAIVAVGVIQMILGWLRWATLGLLFPNAVVQGMLSAIGAIIISKQVPILFGVKAITKLSAFNPEIALIGLMSLALLFLLPKAPTQFLSKIPAPLVVVSVGIFFSYYFDLQHAHIVRFLNWNAEANENQLLKIPYDFRDSITFPDFSRFWTYSNLRAVFSIAMIATLESVLSTFAVDKLDPKKRTSDLNRDLWSKGVCNCLLGVIGGLPIISEIVRSSANISNGAESKWSNFFHGIFILVVLFSFPGVLHKIPLASLAAILMMVGWRLTHPAQFFHAMKIGPDHIFSFVATFVTTLATDLLIGVAVGVLLEVLIAFAHGVRLGDFLTLRYQVQETPQVVTVTIESPALFCNSLKLREVLLRYREERKSVVLNLSQSSFVDHTVLEQIDRFRSVYEASGLSLQSTLGDAHKSLSGHPLATRKKKKFT